MERVHIVIHGRVQGVFFRAHARREAELLHLAGYVRNRSDGSVEAVAEGPRAALERFVAWCHRGPDHARVERVEVAWGPASGLTGGFGVG